MERIEDIQCLWQNQVFGSAALHADREHLHGVHERLLCSEREERRLLFAKILVVGVTLGFLAWRAIPWFGSSVWLPTGFVAILLSLSGIVFLFWKKRFLVSRLPYTENSLAFMEETLARHDRHRHMLQRQLPIGIAGMILGFNLMLLGFPISHSLSWRLFQHVSFSLLLGLAGLLGMRIRHSRYRRHLDPMIRRLRQIHDAFLHEEDRETPDAKSVK